jgi:hypothetical protein
MNKQKYQPGSDEAAIKELRKIPNIGPACAQDLILLGIRSVDDLKKRNPDEMYQALCAATGARQDPCVWDTLAAAVDYAHTGVKKPWWEFTAVRKERGLKL